MENIAFIMVLSLDAVPFRKRSKAFSSSDGKGIYLSVQYKTLELLQKTFPAQNLLRLGNP